MGRRTLLLVAAVLLAAIGTGVLFLFFRATASTLEADAGRDGTVSVLAPAAAVAAGTPIDESVTFQKVSVDANLARRARMIKDVSEIAGQVANQPLAALVPVTVPQFGGAVKQATNLNLEKGQMAVTIDLDDPARVSSFLRPGSRVSVFVLDPESRDTTRKPHEARIVLPDVTVLTIGENGTIVNRATPTAGAAARGASSLVTLQVSTADAGKLLVAKQEGDLYLGLLGDGLVPTPESFDQTDIAVP